MDTLQHADYSHYESAMEFYRIILLPWPPFTDAYKKDRFNRVAIKGGDLISGTK